MSGDLTPWTSSPAGSTPPSHVPAPGPETHAVVPSIVAETGHDTKRKYLEFFAAHIRNRNTRSAYLTAATKFFAWCDEMQLRSLEHVTRLHVAAYIERMTAIHAAPTVKLNLAALKMLFEYLRVPAENPAEGVRGPKHIVRKGRTPVLSAEQARTLLDSINPATLAGLRDRALIATMIYSFGRVSAVVGMNVDDYYLQGPRRWIRLREKGGKEHTVPMHHRAEEMIDAYLAASGIHEGPLFQTLISPVEVSGSKMSRHTVWEMVKRRASAAGLPEGTTNHTFRATGITVYLDNGGTIENARNIAAHASIKTTQAYDRREERITLDEIGRIRL